MKGSHNANILNILPKQSSKWQQMKHRKIPNPKSRQKKCKMESQWVLSVGKRKNREKEKRNKVERGKIDRKINPMHPGYE